MPTADDLIALLEPGPQTTAQLAAWLEVPARDVAALLDTMRRAELVKRVGEWNLQRWALLAWDVPALPDRPKPAPGEPGWWTQFADPALPRQAFNEAAKARDAAMQYDRTWTKRTVPHLKDHLLD